MRAIALTCPGNAIYPAALRVWFTVKFCCFSWVPNLNNLNINWFYLVRHFIQKVWMIYDRHTMNVTSCIRKLLKLTLSITLIIKGKINQYLICAIIFATKQHAVTTIDNMPHHKLGNKLAMNINTINYKQSVFLLLEWIVPFRCKYIFNHFFFSIHLIGHLENATWVKRLHKFLIFFLYKMSLQHSC